eukprot:scaffold48_cov311-Pinguiococcus_pyrenoidosus.AAC.331
MAHRFTEDGTRLEDFIEVAQSTLPLELERGMGLIRDLDQTVEQKLVEISALERKYYDYTTGKLLHRVSNGGEARAAVEEPEALAKLEEKRKEALGCTREKRLIAMQTCDLLDSFISRLDEQLGAFEEQLRQSGEFDVGTAAKGDEVAMMVDPLEDQWILGKVLDYRAETGFYHVCDIEDKEKRFMLSEAQVHVLRQGVSERLQKGDDALAVYPDTTSFYPCVVAAMPRRGGQSTTNSICSVHFHDDADETGVTPLRQVPLQYVIPLANS